MLTLVNRFERQIGEDINLDTKRAVFLDSDRPGVVKEVAIPFFTEENAQVGFLAIECMQDGKIRPLQIDNTNKGIVSLVYNQRLSAGADVGFLKDKMSMYASLVEIDGRPINEKASRRSQEDDVTTVAIQEVQEQLGRTLDPENPEDIKLVLNMIDQFLGGSN